MGKTSLIIRRLLRELAGADVVFVANSPLKNYVRATGKLKPTHQPEPKGTVYKINCSCSKSYVGETGRPLDVRIKEHLASVKKCDQRSALSQHLLGHSNHKILWDNVQKLSINNNDMDKRKLLEAVYIKRIRPELNRDNGMFIHSAYDSII
ncbi:MAG: GIY-YIG nuclease family protein [Candidatus Omnitrophica bacterium]|nr:GIY-YIG nuclease family protein [Candidatus Omnitrophota bacterium]